MFKTKHTYEQLSTTIFGSLILVIALVYLVLNIRELTVTSGVVAGALGAVGVAFIFSKFEWIERFMPGGSGGSGRSGEGQSPPV